MTSTEGPFCFPVPANENAGNSSVISYGLRDRKLPFLFGWIGHGLLDVGIVDGRTISRGLVI